MELKTGAECPEIAGIITRLSDREHWRGQATETGCGFGGAEPTWQTVQAAASGAVVNVPESAVAAAINTAAWR